jgi:Protein involved in cell division
MVNKYDYSYDWDKKYCYPNSQVLINKLGIKDADTLRTAEREITSLKIANAKLNVIKGEFDLEHLKKIHRYIFIDIFDWAGELRLVNIAKGNFFCDFKYIEMNAEEIFRYLREEKFLAGTSLDIISNRLAYYLGEINAMHPFREGNGRAQRLFIEYLAESAGFSVDFSDVSAADMIEASADSFAGDYKKMESIFKRMTK